MLNNVPIVAFMNKLVRGRIANVIPNNQTFTFRSDTITNSLEQILKDYQDTTVDKDVRTDLIVSRTKVLHSAYRGLDRKSFNPRGKLYIKFSGELGQDYGGPRREFFR